MNISRDENGDWQILFVQRDVIFFVTLWSIKYSLLWYSIGIFILRGSPKFLNVWRMSLIWTQRVSDKVPQSLITFIKLWFIYNQIEYCDNLSWALSSILIKMLLCILKKRSSYCIIIDNCSRYPHPQQSWAWQNIFLFFRWFSPPPVAAMYQYLLHGKVL